MSEGQQYKGRIIENGAEVMTATGTILEMANWAENNIRIRGGCTVIIERIEKDEI